MRPAVAAWRCSQTDERRLNWLLPLPREEEEFIHPDPGGWLTLLVGSNGCHNHNDNGNNNISLGRRCV